MLMLITTTTTTTTTATATTAATTTTTTTTSKMKGAQTKTNVSPNDLDDSDLRVPKFLLLLRRLQRP
jgi:hypothetical protein